LEEEEDEDASNEEVLQLKILLSEKEDELLKREGTVAKQQDLINEMERYAQNSCMYNIV